MSNEDRAPGAGVWRRTANGLWEWQRGADDWVRFTPQPPAMSQETIDRIQDAVDDGLALKEQARVDAEREKLRTDLKDELKMGPPAARLAEFLAAIAERGKRQMTGARKEPRPETRIAESLKIAAEREAGEEGD